MWWASNTSPELLFCLCLILMNIFEIAINSFGYSNYISKSDTQLVLVSMTGRLQVSTILEMRGKWSILNTNALPLFVGLIVSPVAVTSYIEPKI